LFAGSDIGDDMTKEIQEGTWQKLLTAADKKRLPKLYSQENNKDPKVWVKFFNPRGSGTWFATEFDGDDTFFGYVMGLGGDELGYFSLSELSRAKCERDQYWKPMSLSAAKATERKMQGQRDEDVESALKCTQKHGVGRARACAKRIREMVEATVMGMDAGRFDKMPPRERVIKWADDADKTIEAYAKHGVVPMIKREVPECRKVSVIKHHSSGWAQRSWVIECDKRPIGALYMVRPREDDKDIGFMSDDGTYSYKTGMEKEIVRRAREGIVSRAFS
jgi:hypothetical protein